MGGTEAFPELGSHCREPSCHQLDFLPFQCDSCNEMFCLEHRSYQAHSCPSGGMKDSRVMICPNCALALKKIFSEQPEITLQKHLQTACDPNNYERVMKKPKCPVKKCRETLTFSNSHVCRSCHLKTCLKHRFPADHACLSGTKAGLRKEATKLAEDFVKILSGRNATECKGSSVLDSTSSSTSPKSVRAH